MTIDFKGAHYPKAVIVHAVFFYVRFAVSYRDLEESLAERGVCQPIAQTLRPSQQYRATF